MIRVFLGLVATAFCAASVAAGPQAPRPPQAPPAPPVAKVSGCGCEEGYECDCTSCKCPTCACKSCALNAARREAREANKPLIIFVGQPTRPIKGCVVVYRATHPMIQGRGVVVCRAKGKDWSRKAIQGTGKGGKIKLALHPPKVVRVAGATYQPMRAFSGCSGGG